MDFVFTIYLLAIFINILTVITSTGFVLPLQFKQAGVKNGLAWLRKRLLIKGLLAIGISVITIAVLSLRFFATDPNIIRILIVGLIFIHALFLLGKSLIDAAIYRQQYTPENVERSNRTKY